VTKYDKKPYRILEFLAQIYLEGQCDARHGL